MNRIPKFTAAMFKRKMPKFGASSIKKPRLPTPPKPRVKKFQEGGNINKNLDVKDMPRDPKWEKKMSGIRQEIENREKIKKPYKSYVQKIPPFIIPKAKSLNDMPFDKVYGMMAKELGEGGSFSWRGKTYVIKSTESSGKESEAFPKPDIIKNYGSRLKFEKKETEKKAVGGSVKSSVSSRADGVAKKGKTKGRFI